MTGLFRSPMARAIILLVSLLSSTGAAIASAALLVTGIARSDAAPAAIVAAIAGSAAVGLVAGALVARSLERRISGMASFALSLADGDLSERLRPRTDERGGSLSALAGALDRLRARLRTVDTDAAEDRSVLTSVLTRMDDGILILGRDESVEFANPAAKRILDLDDGTERRSLVATLRDHHLVRSVRVRLASPGQSSIETGVYVVGSGRRHLRVQAVPLDRRRGLVVLQDVTEIQRADTIRRDFVANVSHDLRTPLASLRAVVETLRDGALDDPPAAREFLKRMETELDDLTQLVLELLELSRIESGQTAFAIQLIDVAELISKTVDRLRPQADRAGLTIEVSIAPTAATAYGDAARIRQALVNLVHNAIKFTPPGGRIDVLSDLGRQIQGAIVLLPRGESAHRATHLVLSVVDTGIGIEPEDQSRIFERFYRADRSRASVGTGLGLAIVKHVAEAHGGRVWVESRPGHGSTFRLALPSQPRSASTIGD